MPLGLALLGLLGAFAQAGPDVVVSAAAPVDGQRLADALRAYFDGQEGGARLRVELAPPALGGSDLRQELDEARRVGQGTRAIAVVRAGPTSAPGGTPGGLGGAAIEIEIVDLATDKVVLATISRPARDSDLYRALALKIHALLRGTLLEAPERIDPGSALGRIALPPGPPSSAARPARGTLDTGYALLSFPLAGPTVHGLAIRAGYLPRTWLELSLGLAALAAARDDVAGVAVLTRVVPSPRPLGSGSLAEGSSSPSARRWGWGWSTSPPPATPSWSDRSAICW